MREVMQKTLTTEDTIKVTDPTSVDWNSFTYPNGYNEHTITKKDVYTPYNISNVWYKTTIYEDLILLLNGVDDIFSLSAGQKLRIPILEDLEEFILEQKEKNLVV
jgi:hypothetical protein